MHGWGIITCPVTLDSTWPRLKGSHRCTTGGNLKLYLPSFTYQRFRWQPKVTKGMKRMSKATSDNTHPRCSYLGVTPPISTSESTEREKELTVTLMEELGRQNMFESEEESQLRWVHAYSHHTVQSLRFWLWKYNRYVPTGRHNITNFQRITWQHRNAYTRSLEFLADDLACLIETYHHVYLQGNRPRAHRWACQEIRPQSCPPTRFIWVGCQRGRRKDIYVWIVSPWCTWTWNRYRYVMCCAQTRFSRGFFWYFRAHAPRPGRSDGSLGM